MNKVKMLSIILLLSLGVVSIDARSGCNDSCSTTDNCDDSCSDSCDSGCGTSTFFRARPISTDLTYRNNLTFYNRYHDARCNFFSWDNTFLYQKNRNEGYLGVGFFGKNPVVVGESADADAQSANFCLGFDATNPVAAGKQFEATVSVCPERKVFAWLPQMFFNLDCFYTGLWADLSFAVVRARHELNYNEILAGGNEGNIPADTDPNIPNNPAVKTVREAFNNNNVFAGDCCTETGVDDVVLRLGYDYSYCSNDHFGVYFLGIAPTGNDVDESRWFPALVGSKHGAVGAGFTGDYTFWCDDANNTEMVFQTELLYQYRLRKDRTRIFDYNNGTFSRGLLVASPDDDASNAVPGFEALTACVSVEPRHQIEWWANVHYQWCNWAAEFSYNLWWRDCEKIDCADFDFDGTGIFDKSSACTGSFTSNSKATIATRPGGDSVEVKDAAFVALTASDVDLCSGAAQRALTHTISGAFAYNSVWADCYPYYVGFGGGYEFASSKNRRHAAENWHVYGKVDVSF